MSNATELPSKNDTKTVFNLITKGDSLVTSGVLSSALNGFIHRQNNDEWLGTDIEICFQNQCFNIFEKIVGYSYEETTLFDFGMRATAEEIAFNELKNLYFKDAKSPHYLVVKECPFIPELIKGSKDTPKTNEGFLKSLASGSKKSNLESNLKAIESLISNSEEKEIITYDIIRLGDIYKENLLKFTSVRKSSFFKGNEDIIKDLDLYDMVGCIDSGFVIRVN